MTDKTYESIMQNIQSALTGDRKHDFEYLTTQIEQYKKHEYGKEIIRECGRMLYNMFSDEEKAKVSAAQAKEDAVLEEELERFSSLMCKGEYENALSVIAPLAEKADEMVANGIFQDDKVNEYYCFNELFEEVLYYAKTDTEKSIRHPSFPFATIYLYYGSVLIDLRRYEEATTALEKAVRWNPSSADFIFELAETWKYRGNHDKFLELTIKAFDIAFTPATVARCYRNLGFYFSEKRQWNMAAGCIVYSLEFAPDDQVAKQEMNYIEHMSDKPIKIPEFDEFHRVADQYGFPTGPSNEVIQIAQDYANYYLNSGKKDYAVYFLKILYDLTEDEKVKNILDDILGETN